MSQTKVVKRSVAITLGIICIILVAGLGIVLFMGYSPTLGSSTTSLQSQLNDLNATYNSYKNTHSHLDSDYNSLSTQNTNLQNQVNQLQTWLDDNITAYDNYVNDHSYDNEQYQNLLTQITNLQNQVNDRNKIINLADSTVWVDDKTVSQPAGGLGFSYTSWAFSVNYAGYVSVNIPSSTSTTYVELIYFSHGVSYDTQIDVGTSGTAIFPVLPATLTIEVGNKNLISGATETVTITYYY